MSTSRSCPRCHCTLSADAPEGLCPACVISTCARDGGTPAEPPPPSVGEVAAAFPELEILRHLRSGGMGHVFHVRQRDSGRPAALKLLSLDDLTAADADYLALSRKEAGTLAALNHSHIVAFYDSGERAGFRHILMEFMEGGDLGQRLREGTLTPHDALAQMPALCDALHHAHGRGIIHRDLKPANILLTTDGRAKLADLGLARHAQATGHSILRTGQVVGTSGFTAPEILDGTSKGAPRSDIYAFGKILQYLQRTAEAAGQPLPPGLAAIVDKAVLDDPTRRYQSAMELKDALENKNGRATNESIDPKSIVIEYDDDWITIHRRLSNGEWLEKVFSSEPYLSEIAEFFGNPDDDGIKTANTEQPLLFYTWSELGLIASSPILDRLDVTDKLAQTRDQTRQARIHRLRILTANPSEHGFYPGQTSFTKPFGGVFKICGLEFNRNWTASQFCSLKPGEPLQPVGQRFLRPKDGSSALIYITAESYFTESWLDKTIEVISIDFEA